jgi:hypothetical protein
MIDFLVATALALIFLALSWVYGRTLSGGRRLNYFKRTLLMWSFVFVLGEVYIMMFVSKLSWPKELLFAMIGLWGVVVAFVAFWLHRRGKRNS